MGDQAGGEANDEGATFGFFGMWTEEEGSQDVVCQQGTAAVTGTQTQRISGSLWRQRQDTPCSMYEGTLTSRRQPSTTRPEPVLLRFRPGSARRTSPPPARLDPFLLHIEEGNINAETFTVK